MEKNPKKDVEAMTELWMNGSLLAQILFERLPAEEREQIMQELALRLKQWKEKHLSPPERERL
jgi:hypothetical protein